MAITPRVKAGLAGRIGRRKFQQIRAGSSTVVALALATLVGAALGLQALPAAASPSVAAASARAGTTGERTVTYHGITLTVPADWPVYRLVNDPTRCVRFDHNAVYLGTPAGNQNCPASAVGQAGAVLVQPLDAAGVSHAMAGLAPAELDGRLVGVAAQNAVQPGYTMVAPEAHAEVVVTSGADAAVTSAIRKSIRAGVAPPALPMTGSGASPLRSAGAGTAAARSRLAAAQPGPSVYTGRAFDICSTPSLSTMAAWSASPYRGIGVYLGGDEAACSQPNLTPSWTAQVAAAGWHLIPIYVGPQAACTGVDFSHVINPSTATAEGRQSAQAAVALASAVGLGTGNPIYYDMESWTISDTSCNNAVLAYLDGWASELRTLGYSSGVYSSASSGITALVSEVGNPNYTEPDELWFGDWNGAATTSDYYVPAAEWAQHQRIHQYSGNVNQTYGGVTLNIDGDYSDALLADSGSGAAPGSIATIGNTYGDVTLAPGETLSAGSSIVTPNGQYRLTMQRSDGDLGLYNASGRMLWDTKTTGNPGAHAVMQASDGNFVVYSAGGRVLWKSSTAGHPGAKLALQTDANLIMYGSGGALLWSTNTVNNELASGEPLMGNWYLESANRSFELLEQKADGNLVLYDYAGRALWSSRTAGHPGANAIVQSKTGNLVVWSASSRMLWNLGIANRSGDRLVMQDDGNLVLYSSSGAVLWATRTS